jgi:hypothetical protein
LVAGEYDVDCTVGLVEGEGFDSGGDFNGLGYGGGCGRLGCRCGRGLGGLLGVAGAGREEAKKGERTYLFHRGFTEESNLGECEGNARVVF